LLYSAIADCDYENTRIHLVDTLGYPDFAGQAIAALAVDAILVVINAQTGIELMIERMIHSG
jgi:elongation factor G